MNRTLLLGLAWVMLGGCDVLPDIQADGRCGNRVVERASGEDCDVGLDGADAKGTCGEPGTVRACRYICSPPGADDEQVRCPDRYACANDGICRRPTGEFDDPRRLPLAASNLVLGDVNRDHFIDLISSQEPTLTVRYGDAQGSFQAEQRLAVNASTAPAVAVDLTGDAVSDVVVFDNRDVQVYAGNEESELKPQAAPLFSVDELGDAVDLVGARVGGGLFPEPTIVEYNSDGVLIRMPLLGAGEPALFEAAVFIDVDEDDLVVPARIGVADLERAANDDTSRTEELAVARVGDSEVLVIEVDCGPNVSFAMACTYTERARLPLPDGLVVQGSGTFMIEEDEQVRLYVAAYDADASPMRRPGEPAPVQLLLATWTGEAFEPLAVVPDFAGVCNMAPCGPDEPVIHDIALFGAEASPLYLTHTGIWRAGQDPRQSAVRNIDELGGGVFVDVNNDGRLDVVGHSGDTLYTLLHQPPLGTGRTFSLIETATTGGGVDRVQVADLNGDLFPDVLIERPGGLTLGINGGTGIIDRQEVVVDGLPFYAVTALPWRLPGDERVADLVLLAEGPEEAEVYLFDGSGTGRIAAPDRTGIELLAMAGIDEQGQSAAFIVGSEAPDQMQMGPMTMPQAVHALMRVERGDGGDPTRSVIELSTTGCPTNYGGDPHIDLIAADLDDDGTSEVVMAYAPPGMGPEETTTQIYRMDLDGDALTCALIARDPLLTGVERLDLADLDGDGRLDLLVVHEPRPFDEDADEDDNGALIVWDVAAAEGWQATLIGNALSERIDGLGASFIDLAAESIPFSGAVAAIQLEPQAEPGGRFDLIIGGEEQVTVARLDRDGISRRFTRDSDVDGQETRALLVADTNGDGLGDLIVHEDDEVLISLQLPCPPAEDECLESP